MPVLMLGSLFAYFLIFNATIGCNTIAYMGRTLESASVSISTGMIWATSLVLALTTPTIFNVLKPTGAFAMFGVNCLIAGIFSLTYLKEIYGLSSDQAKAVYRKVKGDQLIQIRQVKADLNAT